MKRDFDRLSAEEVLALAVHVERANARRFRAFADVFRGYDEAVAERFAELSREEEEHEAILVERHRKRFGGAIPPVGEATVRGVIESIDLDDPDHLIFNTLKPKRVYELALQAETAAREFYRRAAAVSKDTEFRSLYQELADMEGDHETWLEERLKASREHSG